MRETRRRGIIGLVSVGVLATAALGAWLFASSGTAPPRGQDGASTAPSAAVAAPNTATSASPDPVIRLAAGRAHADSIRAELKTLHAAHATALAASAAPLTRPGAVAPAKTASPVPSAVDTGSPFMPAASGSGNQADEALGHYIKDVVRKQFSPLLGSCYEDLLRRHPGQAGKVILDVNVVGDPSVGGVVDTVKFAKGSTLDDTEFATCVEQSMLSVAFAAPPKGADSIDFTYPWELAP